MFYYKKNHRDLSVQELPKPWEWTGSRRPVFESDAAYAAWCENIETSHCFFSAFEGMSPCVRVSDPKQDKDDSNPPVKMHGFIGDYDATLKPGAFENIRNHPDSEFKPAYGSRTYSGHGRLVWVFEKPVVLASSEHAREFGKYFARRVSAPSWLPGLEAPACGEFSKYYEIGTDWEPLYPTYVVPKSLLDLWAWEAAKSLVLWEDYKVYKIPMEKIEEEIHDRFPGKWSGPFAVGAYGVRFWDPSCSETRSARVREDGMYAFSGEHGFLSWKQIFGKSFVEQFEADRISTLLEKTAYDGKAFYLKEGEAHWEAWSKDDFTQLLKVEGYHSTKSKGDTCSEVDRMEMGIKRQRRVDRVAHLVHFPDGVVQWRGTKFLNLGSAKALPPAPTRGEPIKFSEGPKYFPLLHQWFSSIFVDAEGEDKYNQLQYLLAWIKYFYTNALAQTPQQGQAIVLAGKVNMGKSFFSQGIMGGLMGGSQEGTDHLVEGSSWTEALVHSPVIYVDDAMATKDQRTLVAFTNRLKKYIANAVMHSNAKYKATGDVPWFGRIIITCNLDSESIRILPSMDISTRDKLSLFKAADTRINFPPRSECERMIRQELPQFARFLLDMPYPEFTVPKDLRFGVRPFHHPELLETSMQQGASGILLEVLTKLMKIMKDDPQNKGREFWEGTAMELYQLAVEANPHVKSEFSIRSFCTTLGTLSKNGFNLESYTDRKSKTKLWKVGFDLSFMRQEETDE